MSPSKQFSHVLREWAEVFTRRSMREFRRFMADSGLSPAQMHALMHLHFGGECGVSQIGAHLGVTNAGASQLVERLVQHGLVDRREDAHDRRVKQLALTDAGHGLARQAIEARRRWMEELTASLTPDQQSAISTALTALTEAARRLEPEN